MIMKHLLRYSPVWKAGGAPGAYVTRADVEREPWMAAITKRNGYVTVTVTPEALENEALDAARDGDAYLDITTACAPSPALHDWPHGADASQYADAIAFAGEDLVRLWLARTPPKQRTRLDPARLARHLLSNPPYAVLYAHAAAAAVLRWAESPPGEFRPGRLSGPGELMLLDALSWLPERVASAARRGRPDMLARHLETLASRTVDIISTRRFSPGQVPDSERLWLVLAAKTGLAAGLGLLGITAPERL